MIASNKSMGQLKRWIILIGFLAACLASTVQAQEDAATRSSWSTAEAETLLRWMERAPDEAITLPPDSARALRLAIDGGDGDALDVVARQAALALLRAWRGRCCSAERPSWWHIDGTKDDAALMDGLDQALQLETLDLYLRSVRPSHPHYEALIEQYRSEQHTGRKTVLAGNLARWRWLPGEFGDRYLMVNIASQRLTLWDGGRVAGRWRVIIGKPATRTPVFTTQVTGVVLNPWWEIPSSIAAEGIASLVRRNPAAARARGYVYQDGRYRQMPGDNNALGRMKLIMPNPYSVFLHDTSNRDLFNEERRAFSHGCVRVDRALPFAATLLTPDGWDLARVEQVVASGKTTNVAFSQGLPLYVTYFTAEPAPSGEVIFLEDIYRRDAVRLDAETRAETTDNYGSPQAATWDNLAQVAGSVPCEV